jgi:predicted nucleic acid-binding protein
VPQRVVLLDTSFIIALENRRDPHHARAKALDRELLQQSCISLLHWGILLEIADGYARINRRAKGAQLLDKLENEQRYQLHPITDSLLQQARGLYRKHEDKDWGLTDCISFVLMRQEGIAESRTADIHFRQAGFTALLLES